VARYICKHFELYELVDPVTYKRFGDRAWMFFDDETLMMIDGIREYFGVPTTINDWYWGGRFQWSGLRTIDCTEGSKWSIHRLAKGFDMKAKGIPAETMRGETMAHQDHDLLRYINRMENGVSWLMWIGQI
jgi:hypothetical protein